jgi:energy-converting hydrogenase Eha subunit B
MMKKALWIILVLTVALLALIGGAFAQDKPGIVGTWAGHTFIGDGVRAEIILVVDKGAGGLTAKIMSETEMFPELICRNVAFAGNRLTCDLDFPDAMGTVLISVSLTLEGDALTGYWANPDGDSDVIELARRK